MPSHAALKTVEIWPSRGTNASLMAFNPKSGLVYVNSWEIARILKYTKFEFMLGQGSTASRRASGRRRQVSRGVITWHSIH